jgi:hypothetical protein
MSEGYNGYTNYETWNVALWIDNDQGSQSYWEDVAQEVWNDSEGTQYRTRDRVAVSELAGRLKSEHEDNAPSLEGTYGDLLSAALGSVNWHEIAELMLGEVDKTEESEDEE